MATPNTNNSSQTTTVNNVDANARGPVISLKGLIGSVVVALLAFGASWCLKERDTTIDALGNVLSGVPSFQPGVENTASNEQLAAVQATAKEVFTFVKGIREDSTPIQPGAFAQRVAGWVAVVTATGTALSDGLADAPTVAGGRDYTVAVLSSLKDLEVGLRKADPGDLVKFKRDMRAPLDALRSAIGETNQQDTGATTTVTAGSGASGQNGASQTSFAGDQSYTQDAPDGGSGGSSSSSNSGKAEFFAIFEKARLAAQEDEQKTGEKDYQIALYNSLADTTNAGTRANEAASQAPPPTTGVGGSGGSSSGVTEETQVTQLLKMATEWEELKVRTFDTVALKENALKSFLARHRRGGKNLGAVEMHDKIESILTAGPQGDEKNDDDDEVEDEDGVSEMVQNAPWSPAEDETLIRNQRIHRDNWIEIAKALTGRSGDSAKDRWGWIVKLHNVRIDSRLSGSFTEEETLAAAEPESDPAAEGERDVDSAGGDGVGADFLSFSLGQPKDLARTLGEHWEGRCWGQLCSHRVTRAAYPRICTVDELRSLQVCFRNEGMYTVEAVAGGDQMTLAGGVGADTGGDATRKSLDGVAGHHLGLVSAAQMGTVFESAKNMMMVNHMLEDGWHVVQKWSRLLFLGVGAKQNAGAFALTIRRIQDGGMDDTCSASISDASTAPLVPSTPSSSLPPLSASPPTPFSGSSSPDSTTTVHMDTLGSWTIMVVVSASQSELRFSTGKVDKFRLVYVATYIRGRETWL
jgi:hypothetical protein